MTTLTDTFGLATTNWTRTLAGVSQFNPAMGTLTGVAITLNGDIVQNIKAENLGATPDVLTPTASANFLYRRSGVTLQTLPLASVGVPFNATAFDGTDDKGGTSGKDFGNLLSSGMLSFAGVTLADYIGVGNLGIFDIRAIGLGSVASDNGNISTVITTQARENFRIIYTFTPAAPGIPEPTSLALIALALLGAGVASRRKA